MWKHIDSSVFKLIWYFAVWTPTYHFLDWNRSIRCCATYETHVWCHVCYNPAVQWAKVAIIRNDACECNSNSTDCDWSIRQPGTFFFAWHIAHIIAFWSACERSRDILVLSGVPCSRTREISDLKSEYTRIRQNPLAKNVLSNGSISKWCSTAGKYTYFILYSHSQLMISVSSLSFIWSHVHFACCYVINSVCVQFRFASRYMQPTCAYYCQDVLSQTECVLHACRTPPCSMHFENACILLGQCAAYFGVVFVTESSRRHTDI